MAKTLSSLVPPWSGNKIPFSAARSSPATATSTAKKRKKIHFTLLVKCKVTGISVLEPGYFSQVILMTNNSKQLVFFKA